LKGVLCHLEGAGSAERQQKPKEENAMKARLWPFLLVVILATALLSGCLPKDRLAVENTLTKLTERFVEGLEAGKLGELEVLFADKIVLYPGTDRLLGLAGQIEDTKLWLTYHPEADGLADEYEIWAKAELAALREKYEQDPDSPELEELAGAAAEKMVLGYVFCALTMADTETVAEWLSEAGFSLKGITAPQAVLSRWFASNQGSGYNYEVRGKGSFLQDESRWYIPLMVVEDAPDYVDNLEFVLGFSKQGSKWLIDYFRVIYN